MKNKMYLTAAVAALACLVSLEAGCSHPQPAQAPIVSGPVISQDQFLTQVANLPMDKRVAFVEANTATVQTLDATGKAKLQSLFPSQ